MQALVLHDIGDLRVEEVPTPEPGPGQVRVRVAWCGVCGSDIPRIFRKGAYAYPRICGHEFAGVVDAIGPDVTRVKTGDRVTVFPLIWCGTCPACEQGVYARCLRYDYLGSRGDGGFAEYVLAPARNLLRLPAGVRLDEAAMTEPAAVALHALRRAGGAEGRVTTIFGCGPIGLLTALHARLQGAARILLFDIDGRRRDLARSLGFGHCFDPNADSPAEIVRRLTDGAGAALGIDAAGVPAATLAALDCVRPGGVLTLLGNPTATLHLDPAVLSTVLRREITIIGSWNSSYSVLRDDDDWHTVVGLLARSSRFGVRRLISHKIDYPEAPALLRAVADHRVFTMKILIGKGAAE